MINPKQALGTVPGIHQRGAPFDTGASGALVLELVGQVASVVASVGLVQALVVLEACVVHMRHMARLMETVEVPLVAPAREEPRLGPPDAVSPGGRTAPLHIRVLLSAVQAGAQQEHKQQKSHSSAGDQAPEGRALQEAQRSGAGHFLCSAVPCCFLPSGGPWTLLSQLLQAGEQPGSVGAAFLGWSCCQSQGQAAADCGAARREAGWEQGRAVWPGVERKAPSLEIRGLGSPIPAPWSSDPPAPSPPWLSPLLRDSTAQRLRTWVLEPHNSIVL